MNGLPVATSVMLGVFGLAALVGAVLVLTLRHPMRVALALVATMLALAAIYGLLGAHALAVFQVMIYVGAVMVFMVYAIMLLDLRDASMQRRTSPGTLLPALVGGAALSAALLAALRSLPPRDAAGAVAGAASPAPAGAASAAAVPASPGSLTSFAASLLGEHWLAFELGSLLLLVAVVAAVAVVRRSSAEHRRPHDAGGATGAVDG